MKAARSAATVPDGQPGTGLSGFASDVRHRGRGDNRAACQRSGKEPPAAWVHLQFLASGPYQLVEIVESGHVISLQGRWIDVQAYRHHPPDDMIEAQRHKSLEIFKIWKQADVQR
jgi:hypothetical protein